MASSKPPSSRGSSSLVMELASCWPVEAPSCAPPGAPAGTGGASCGALDDESAVGSHFGAGDAAPTTGAIPQRADAAASSSPGAPVVEWGWGLVSRLVRFAGVERGSASSPSRLTNLPGLALADPEGKRER